MMSALEPLTPLSIAPAMIPTDTARLEEMYRAYHRVIWRTLRRLGFAPEAAADATHQAYVIAAERLGQVVLGCEKAFLFSTAIRLAKTSARKNRRVDLQETVEERPERSGVVEVQLQRQHARQLLDRVLSRMDEELLTVFTLFELEELSSPEIAELLGIPLGTVASRLRRARMVFKAAAERLEASARPLPGEGNEARR